MRKKQRFFYLSAIAFLAACLLAACGSAGQENSPASSSAAVSQQEEEQTERQTSDASSKSENTTAADEPAGNEADQSVSSDGITTNGGTEIPLSSLEHETNDESVPEVFYLADISPESLVQVYQALEWNPEGAVAVKLSTGEPPASNYLRPELIEDLVHEVDGTIVECMTAYGGQRSSAASAKQVAEDHGYTGIADFDLMDEDGDVSIPVEGGTRLDEALIGSHIENYDNVLVLSHFKGHSMAGFGGAIKNVAIGMSSREGKSLVHSGGTSTTNTWGGEQDAFLEAMGEATKGVSDYLNNGDNIVYVSVMNRLSVDCDCDGNPAEPDMHDIGVLASHDPVALDQACVDLVYAAPDGDSLIQRMESRNGIHTLEHAEEIGLGSRSYRLVDLSNE